MDEHHRRAVGRTCVRDVNRHAPRYRHVSVLDPIDRRRLGGTWLHPHIMPTSPTHSTIPTNEHVNGVERAPASADTATPDFSGRTRALVPPVSRLAAAALRFEHDLVDQTWLWREARLRDPDGNQLCLFHAGENRLNPPWRLSD
jgi:hypothetical protein